MRAARLIIGLPVALCGLFLVGMVVFGAPPSLMPNDASNSILYASMGVLLVAFAAVITFR